MRKAGDVVFSDVDRNGGGVVEFSNRDDMEYAIKSLDDTELKGRDESSYIRVKAVRQQRDRSQEDSRPAKSSGGRSSRSPSRDRSVSRDRSRSRDRGGKRSAHSDDEADRDRDSAPAAKGDEEPAAAAASPARNSEDGRD
jgi:RNA recognition motif-containing protein